MSQPPGTPTVNAMQNPVGPFSVRPDSTGTLKTTIMLGKNPSVLSGPFYLIRADPIGKVWLVWSIDCLIGLLADLLIFLLFFYFNSRLTLSVRSRALVFFYRRE